MCNSIVMHIEILFDNDVMSLDYEGVTLLCCT